MDENVRGKSRESTETMERKFTGPGSTWNTLYNNVHTRIKKKSGEKICRNVREEIMRMKVTESKGNPIQLSEQRGLNYTHNFSSCLATNEL